MLMQEKIKIFISSEREKKKYFERTAQNHTNHSIVTHYAKIIQ